jgi:hypothetical protein
MALALPMVLGPPTAGVLLDVLEPWGHSQDIEHLGWKVLWFFCGSLFIAGTFCIRQLDSSVPGQPPHSLPLIPLSSSSTKDISQL